MNSVFKNNASTTLFHRSLHCFPGLKIERILRSSIYTRKYNLYNLQSQHVTPIRVYYPGFKNISFQTKFNESVEAPGDAWPVHLCMISDAFSEDDGK